MHHLSESDGLDCPFCGGRYSSARSYWNHIANHQEQLALFILGQEDLDPEDVTREIDDIESSSEPEWAALALS
jgi:hypothetical protein